MMIEDHGMSKKIFIFCIVGILSVFLLGDCLAKGGAKYESYLADRYKKEFHLVSCPEAQDIHPDNMVTFDTHQEAIDAGYKPCDECHPQKEKSGQ